MSSKWDNRITHLARKEIERMRWYRPKGISCYQADEDSNILEGRIIGPQNTPYANGLFKLEIELDCYYPLNPPQVRFTTPVYHPNVDFRGRMCLDILKKYPEGTWREHMTIMKVLIAIRDLLISPDVDNPIVPEFAHDYKYDRERFDAAAIRYTMKHAKRC